MKHQCHAKGCNALVQPSKFMCPQHWGMLSGLMKVTMSDLYRAGQEVDKKPSREYVKAARGYIEYIKRIEEAASNG